jgi:hypothetical protein
MDNERKNYLFICAPILGVAPTRFDSYDVKSFFR